ncbi:membrane-bound serine protease (ClpP class) [Thiohalospira halophila DSM 15071]|uniref:Membrane-bound serine protease (ClpP class) n=1 Tax=Thiohalospira halophila DSM 15071 TaxID=1123397 RepID=A0A1I1QWT2_9GAMM|nr:nodulation protein NfeD [Thiohalospira halophila]SFD26581.1 membrane-bound serine protease (ClpP class) [Thiohalospira halophila DSM 15071]
MARPRIPSVRWLLPLALLLFAVGGTPAEAAVHRLSVDGPIGPATAGYIEQGLDEAATEGAAAVLLQLDTPGGLTSSTRRINDAILASPVPVIGYVAPAGARAASAGTYILYASHIAAMAPGTHLGAATPVQLGGAPGTPPQQPSGEDEAGEEAAPAPKPGNATERKAVNDAVAYLRGLAELRGRNAEWAEAAVREAATLTADEAEEKRVIDLVAADTTALLNAVDGRTLDLPGGERKLATAGEAVSDRAPDWRTRLLETLTHPNVAYILLIIGIYGLIFEFANPGGLVPGIAGAICLLLALYALQALPVNYAGIALILLGVALMIAEAFAPSFGALGLGGVIAFVAGSLLLIDTHAPGFGISIPLIATMAILSAGILLVIARLAVRSHRNPVVSGAEEITGAEAVATTAFTGHGWVHLHGEAWQAESPRPVAAGQRVRVTRRDGLTLHVEPLDQVES